MEFLCSFLRRHFAGKPVVASPNVGCFLRLHFSNELCSHFTEAKALLSQSPPRLYNHLISYSNNFSSSNLEAAVGRAYSHDKKTQLTLASVCHGFATISVASILGGRDPYQNIVWPIRTFETHTTEPVEEVV